MLSLPLAASLWGQSLTERLDSILASPQDTHQVRALVELSDIFSLELMEIPDVLFERGLELANRLNDNRGLADLYEVRYIYYLNGGEVTKGLAAVAQAKKYARLNGQPGLLRYASIDEVILLMIGGDTEKAAVSASELAKEFKASGDLIGETEAYGLLSTLNSGFGNYSLAVAYDSSAIERARLSGSPMTLSRALVAASSNRSLLSDPEGALKLAEEALQIALEEGNAFGVENALGARAEANTMLGNYAKALEDYNELKEGEGNQRVTWQMTSKGLLLQRIGRHDEARELLLEAENIIQTTSKDPLELKRCYQALQTVGLNQMQYDSVVWYGQLMRAQQDSLQTAKNIKNLLELDEKYKAEEKEIEIRLQQEQLARQQIKLYATVFGLLLAIVGGIGFFLLSRRLKKRNLEKEQLLTDKETLIGEIHHRVKNNLQVVSSLLQIQRRGLGSDDEKGREALLESQSRVSAMGLIHNKLYQGKEVTSVHMPEYLKDLGETLLDAYRQEEQVEIFYDVADISLDVDIAIPLGLIINELVTNSIKYAFPKGREGTIEISLHRERDQLRLLVADNGVGAAAAEKRIDSTAFGTNLIGLLIKKLKGEIEILEGQGYGVGIRFPELKLVNN